MPEFAAPPQQAEDSLRSTPNPCYGSYEFPSDDDFVQRLTFPLLVFTTTMVLYPLFFIGIIGSSTAGTFVYPSPSLALLGLGASVLVFAALLATKTVSPFLPLNVCTRLCQAPAILALILYHTILALFTALECCASLTLRAPWIQDASRVTLSILSILGGCSFYWHRSWGNLSAVLFPVTSSCILVTELLPGPRTILTTLEMWSTKDAKSGMTICARVLLLGLAAYGLAQIVDGARPPQRDVQVNKAVSHYASRVVELSSDVQHVMETSAEQERVAEKTIRELNEARKLQREELAASIRHKQALTRLLLEQGGEVKFLRAHRVAAREAAEAAAIQRRGREAELEEVISSLVAEREHLANERDEVVQAYNVDITALELEVIHLKEKTVTVEAESSLALTTLTEEFDEAMNLIMSEVAAAEAENKRGQAAIGDKDMQIEQQTHALKISQDKLAGVEDDLAQYRTLAGRQEAELISCIESLNRQISAVDQNETLVNQDSPVRPGAVLLSKEKEEASVSDTKLAFRKLFCAAPDDTNADRTADNAMTTSIIVRPAFINPAPARMKEGPVSDEWLAFRKPFRRAREDPDTRMADEERSKTNSNSTDHAKRFEARIDTYSLEKRRYQDVRGKNEDFPRPVNSPVGVHAADTPEFPAEKSESSAPLEDVQTKLSHFLACSQLRRTSSELQRASNENRILSARCKRYESRIERSRATQEKAVEDINSLKHELQDLKCQRSRADSLEDRVRRWSLKNERYRAERDAAKVLVGIRDKQLDELAQSKHDLAEQCEGLVLEKQDLVEKYEVLARDKRAQARRLERVYQDKQVLAEQLETFQGSLESQQAEMRLTRQRLETQLKNVNEELDFQQTFSSGLMEELRQSPPVTPKTSCGGLVSTGTRYDAQARRSPRGKYKYSPTHYSEPPFFSRKAVPTTTPAGPPPGDNDTQMLTPPDSTRVPVKAPVAASAGPSRITRVETCALRPLYFPREDIAPQTESRKKPMALFDKEDKGPISQVSIRKRSRSRTPGPRKVPLPAGPAGDENVDIFTPVPSNATKTLQTLFSNVPSEH